MSQKIVVFGDLPEQVIQSLGDRNRESTIRQSVGQKLFATITSHVPEEALRKHDFAREFDLIQVDAKDLTKSDVLDALKNHEPAGVLMKLFSPPADIRDKSVAAMAHEVGVSAFSTCTVGTDHLNMAQLSRLKIPLFHTPDVLTEAVALHALSMILALTHGLFQADRFVRSGQWAAQGTASAHSILAGPDLFSWTIGIVGMGRIGTEVLHHLAGYGPNVIWTDADPNIRGRAPTLEQQFGALARQRGYEPSVQCTGLEELLQRSDLVTVHTDLNATSSSLFNEEFFAKMKKGAYFVNTARGGVADYEVLYRHLACGRLGGAGLDVFAQEPLIPKDLCRLADLPNVIVTPHTASNRFETRLSMAYLSCYALMTWLLGYRPTCIANPEVFV